MSLPLAYDTPEMHVKLAMIAASYRRLIGEGLIPPGADPARAIWEHPRAIVAHGAEADPIFFFGNRVALARFEMTPEGFAEMPSRLSAGPVDREERQRALDAVAAKGFIAGYSGLRVSSTGKRFRIHGGMIWNLGGAGGALQGQAACFDRWDDLGN